jgi:dihydrofolate reductase
MTVSLIVAAAENGVIGRGNQLPWRLSADLQRFKQLTMGHAVIMGRRTFESIGRPLPGRRMIVVSRQGDFRPQGVQRVRSLDEACQAAAEHGDSEAMVIGGAEIFRQVLPAAERLYLTRVHAEPPGDVYFPALDWRQWRLISAESHGADAKNDYPFTFEIYQRIAR